MRTVILVLSLFAIFANTPANARRVPPPDHSQTMHDMDAKREHERIRQIAIGAVVISVIALVVSVNASQHNPGQFRIAQF